MSRFKLSFHSHKGWAGQCGGFYLPLVPAGDRQYWHMFEAAYTAALGHYKAGSWYPSADIFLGARTHMQFTSLQAFWPGGHP